MFKIEELSSRATLRWLWERFPFDEFKRKKKVVQFFANQVALGGNVTLLRWLKEVKKVQWTCEHCCAAVQNGYVDAIKYMRKTGC